VEEIHQLVLIVVFAAVLLATSHAFIYYRSSKNVKAPAAVTLRAEKFAKPTFPRI
jgi:hypothetical protein